MKKTKNQRRRDALTNLFFNYSPLVGDKLLVAAPITVVGSLFYTACASAIPTVGNWQLTIAYFVLCCIIGFSIGKTAYACQYDKECGAISIIMILLVDRAMFAQTYLIIKIVLFTLLYICGETVTALLLIREYRRKKAKNKTA